MKAIFLLLILSIAMGTGTAWAENGSAGDLGKAYGLKFTQPIVIGPLYQIERGKLPASPVLEDSLGQQDGTATEEQQFVFAFNPSPDFDEYLRNRYAEDLLYEALHIGGSRMSKVLTPVARVDYSEVKQSRASRPARPVPRPSRR